MTPELLQRLNPILNAAWTEGAQDPLIPIKSACSDIEGLEPSLKRPSTADVQNSRLLEPPPPHSDDQLNPSENRFQPGELVLGRFRIMRPIGKGGMDEVYEAEDLQLGTVAIKTIRHNVAHSSPAYERFCREVQLARRVTGPQICRIHELHLIPASGEQEATAFLTMEYLDGITLSDKVRRDGPFPLNQAISIALEICEGLRLMHENHIIHRDLKSENIMLCEQNGVLRVVLMDFGLAREFRRNPAASADTNPVKSPLNAAQQSIASNPEQPDHKPISPATDIYALGVVLYVLTTGLHPNSANSSNKAPSNSKSEVQQPAPRPTVPRQFDRILERCMEFNTNKSFKSVSEVAAALRLASPNLDNLRRERSSIIWTMSALLMASVTGGLYALWLAQLFYRLSRTPQSGFSYRERFAWGLAALLFLLVVFLWVAYVHRAH